MLEYFEERLNPCLCGPMFDGQVVKHSPAGQRNERRELANDKAIAREIQSRRGKAQLSIRAFSRLKLMDAEQGYICYRFCRPAVEVNSGAIFQRPHGGEEGQGAIKSAGSFKKTRRREDHAAR